MSWWAWVLIILVGFAVWWEFINYAAILVMWLMQVSIGRVLDHFSWL